MEFYYNGWTMKSNWNKNNKTGTKVTDTKYTDNQFNYRKGKQKIENNANHKRKTPLAKQ